MSRRRSLKGGEDKTDINISPMIDMVFILLIFFIVTTVFVDEAGLEADKPRPSLSPSPSDGDGPIKLTLTKNKEVLFNEKNIDLSGVRNNVTQELKRSSEERNVILNVEEKVPSGFMIRVMDEARIAGAKVSIQHAAN